MRTSIKCIRLHHCRHSPVIITVTLSICIVAYALLRLSQRNYVDYFRPPDIRWPTVEFKHKLRYVPTQDTEYIKSYPEPPIKMDPRFCKLDEKSVQATCAIIPPSFIIIGGQKCGTTTMFHHLLQHPSIAPLYHNSSAIGHKEVRFFDKPSKAYQPNLNHYLYNFARRNVTSSEIMITGEATPNYMHHIQAPKRIKELFPNVKLILMLRDPVDRAYSHYNHALSIEQKDLLNYSGGNSFEALLNAELAILSRCQHLVSQRWPDLLKCIQPFYANATAELNIPKSDKSGGMVWLLQMISRGLYAQQLSHYLEYFSPSQMLIVQSEEFYGDTGNVLRRVHRFLNIRELSIDQRQYGKAFNFGARNTVVENENSPDKKARYSAGSMRQDTKTSLAKFFRPFNERLTAMFEDPQVFNTWLK